MRPRVTIRDVMRVDPVAGVMGIADDRDEALRLAAESAPSGTSVEQMASAAAEIIRSRVAQKAPPEAPYFYRVAPIESFEVLPPAPEPPAPEPPLGDHASPTEPDPVQASPEPGDDAAPAPAPEPPPAAPARPTKPRK